MSDISINSNISSNLFTDNLSHKCLDHYKEDNPKLWSFYIYFIVAQLSIIILTMVLFSVAK